MSTIFFNFFIEIRKRVLQGPFLRYHGYFLCHVEIFSEEKGTVAVSILLDVCLTSIEAGTDDVTIDLRVLLAVPAGAVVISQPVVVLHEPLDEGIQHLSSIIHLPAESFSNSFDIGVHILHCLPLTHSRAPLLIIYFRLLLPMEHDSLLVNMLPGPGYFVKNRDFS